LSVEFFLVLLAAVILCVVSYLAADRIYALHHKLRKGDNLLSRAVTADAKNFNDKEKWIRRYRTKTALLLVIIILIPIIRFFSA